MGINNSVVSRLDVFLSSNRLIWIVGQNKSFFKLFDNKTIYIDAEIGDVIKVDKFGFGSTFNFNNNKSFYNISITKADTEDLIINSSLSSLTNNLSTKTYNTDNYRLTAPYASSVYATDDYDNKKLAAA